MSNSSNQPLLISGTILFVLSLITGFTIEAVENPRMGLSAHLAALQGSMFLLVFSAIWPQLRLSERLRSAAATTLIAGMYGFWLTLVLAANWGTSEATPIAGGDFTGSDWQEAAVMAFLSLASLSVFTGSILLLIGSIGRLPSNSQ